MEKNIIIFGTGRGYQSRKKIIDSLNYNIVEFWDNSPKIDSIDGINVVRPHRDIEVDKIIITSNIYYSEIHEILTKEFGFSESVIEKYSWFEKQIIQKKYKDSDDKEIKKIIDYLAHHDLGLLNYEWIEDYIVEDVEVQYDYNSKMFYHLYEGKCMYIKKSMDDLFMVENNMTDELKAKTYVRTLLVEQDKRSPHYYWNYNNFDNKIVIDLGAAEGNFSLHIIDRCKKVIMVETDTGWIEALEKSFSNYKDKIVIIPKYVGNTDDEKNITLKSIFKQCEIGDEDVVIKMDIEGAEEMVLEASEELLKDKDNIDILTCTYHHSKGLQNIKGLLRKYGYNVMISEGFIFFSTSSDNQTMQYNNQSNDVDLRRGLIYASKHNLI